MTLYTYPLIDIQGPTGPTGPTGAQGFVGSLGSGYTGSASTVVGPTGPTGESGLVGYMGSQGAPGYTGSLGYTGSAGADGVVGYRGSQGITGYVGSRGDLGYTGSSGTVGFVGSEGLRGFAGYTGSRGDLGFTGSAGTEGFVGSNGLRGFTGYTGSKGDLGFTGSRGEGGPGYTGSVGAGAAGYTGSRGAVGFTGSKGDAGGAGGAGYTGSRGDVGFTGSRGTTGIGYVGSRGVDAAGYTGSQGFTGSAGVSLPGFTGSSGADATGFVGSRGAVGYTGSRGDLGTVGYTGSTGAQGAIGFTGSKGEDAAVGYRGSQGEQGDAGYTGSRGATGFTGSIGFTGSVGYTGSRGDLGFTGSRGFVGSQGAGYTGSQGYTGSTGYTGSIGFTGSEGVRGQRGELGYTGSLGLGTVGYTGSRGIVGYTGSQGIAGTGGFSAIPSSTAVTPGFPLAVDANTGLFGNTDDQIGISTGGSARVVITNTQTQLTNELSGTTALFTSGSTQVSINTNVGSGTTNGLVLNSDGNLEIIRSSGGAYIDFKNSATENYDFRIQQQGVTQTLEFWSGAGFAAGLDQGSLYLNGALNASYLTARAQGGAEGGQMLLARAPTGSTLAGFNLVVDTVQNRLRVFESGSPFRGAFLNIDTTANGVASELLHSNNFSTYLNGSYVLKSGDTMTGSLGVINDITTYRSAAPTTGAVYFGNTGTRYLYYDGRRFQLTGQLDVTEGLVSSGYDTGGLGGQLRLKKGASPAAILRNDGTTTYLLFTNNGDPDGGWNGLRPFYVNNANGLVSMDNNLFVRDIFRQGDWNTDAGSGQFLAAHHSIFMNNPDRDGLSIRSTVVRNNTTVQNNNMINLWATSANSWPNLVANAITFTTGGGQLAGTITIGNNVTAYNSASDYRLKTNVETLPNALELINSVPAVAYDFISNPLPWKVFGFIAHEVDEQIKGIVTGKKDQVSNDGTPRYQGIDTSKLVPVAWNAIRELHQLVKDQQAAITALQAQVNALSTKS